MVHAGGRQHDAADASAAAACTSSSVARAFTAYERSSSAAVSAPRPPLAERGRVRDDQRVDGAVAGRVRSDQPLGRAVFLEICLLPADLSSYSSPFPCVFFENF